ncbi:hypothetical protein [Nocardioides lianchengensis]|uniref:Uncharacterized protein n=1 Tax=Nocardioides lianchengensis TaxID=1045774 RepID=A0A1G6JT06_9ACTN|nr:hypothetical protein [Nocardioides lianchengensis]NYG08761.1 hypothetical protein [Nocardioides lianchengensis]SDC21565.1 hypothetical protein SAMN05421872_101566 [Nocardioides lianchengensis]
MPRHHLNQDRITVARLDGTATRHVHAKSPVDVAVAELVEIATDRVKGRAPVLRVDLLSETAGAMLGAWQADPVKAWAGEAASRLLVAAGGTDEEVGRAAAAEVVRRMSRSQH